MKTLDEQQREWLDAAIRNKGRFTSKKSIEKSFQEYQRRRAKTATALEGMPDTAPLRDVVVQHLKDADAFAEEGKFSKAYVSLSKIKGQAKAVAGDKLDAIATSTLTTGIDAVEAGLNTIYAIADYTVSNFGALVRKVEKLEPASDGPFLLDAIRKREAIAQAEPGLLAELNACVVNRDTTKSRINAHTPLQAIEALEQQILSFEQAGLAKAVLPQKQRLAVLRTNCEEYEGRYHDPAVLLKVEKDSRDEIERLLRAAKDFGDFAQRSTEDAPSFVAERPDDRLEEGITGLKALSPKQLAELEKAETEQLKIAETKLWAAGIIDPLMLAEKDMGPVQPSPEPARFNADDLFDGLIGETEELPDDIPSDMARDLITFVTQKLKGLVKDLGSGSDELVDLFCMSPTDLAKMANKALTGIDSAKGLTQSHDLMLKQLSEAMVKAIAESSANKVAADRSEMTLGDEKWILLKTLGEGAGGTALLYGKEGNPSETIVAKTPNPLDEYNAPYKPKTYEALSPEDKKAAIARGREAMAVEMRTHHRLSKDMKGDEKAKNLLEMSGSAVGPDGELFMVMETAAGGDVAGVGMAMSAVQNIGVIPPQARAALSRDLLIQTVKGLKALEQRGLIHNDLKPENILMTEDGTLKIMDFGESRFGDEDGKTDNYRTVEGTDKAFRMTPGYEGDEQFVAGGKVDSKSDVFAFGVMAKVLAADEYSSGAIKKKESDKTAIGKMIAAATSGKPEDRPSLDALLATSVLVTNDEEFAAETVEDLRKAMIKFSMTMSAAETKWDPDEVLPPIPAEERPLREGIDPELAKKQNEEAEKRDTEVAALVLAKLTKKIDGLDSDTLSLIDLQFISKSILDDRTAAISAMNRANLEQRDDLKKAVEANEKAVLWVQARMKALTEATKTKGAEQYDALLEDEDKKLVVPGEGGGEMTVKAAVALRDQTLLAIKTLQSDFYAYANDHPELAAKELEATNATLTALNDQVQAINDGVFKLLGKEGKFMIAEQDLAEIGRAFEA